MRRILLPTLLLLATAAVSGTTYTVARNSQDHTHRHARVPAGHGAGQVQAQSAKYQSGQGHAEGWAHARHLTLASNSAGRDSLSDVADGDRHDHDRVDFQSPGVDAGFEGAGRADGSADTGKPGGSEDGGWGNRFASYGSPALGSGGGGSLSKPDQGAGGAPTGDQGGQHGGPPTISKLDVGGLQPKNFVMPPVAGVPEPSTWMMMLVGVGALGAMLRRGRVAARTAGVASR